MFVLALGLITLVVNALMLLLTSWVCGKLDLSFHVQGFWTAVIGGLIVSVWKLVSTSDVRIGEAIALNVSEVDVDRQVVHLKETKEGGAFESGITAETACLLGGLIGDRKSGPVFTKGTARLRREEVLALIRERTGKSARALTPHVYEREPERYVTPLPVRPVSPEEVRRWVEER